MKIRVAEDRYIPIPSGEYRVEVVSINETTWGHRLALEWKFKIVDGVYVGNCLNGKTTLYAELSRRQKLGRWYCALIGRWLRQGEELDTEVLMRAVVGKIARSSVVLGTSRRGKPANKIELIPEALPILLEDSD